MHSVAQSKPHTCRRPSACTCSIQALEPDEQCPVHGAGEWPPRCEVCGRFMQWEEGAVGPLEEADV